MILKEFKEYENKDIKVGDHVRLIDHSGHVDINLEDGTLHNYREIGGYHSHDDLVVVLTGCMLESSDFNEPNMWSYHLYCDTVLYNKTKDMYLYTFSGFLNKVEEKKKMTKENSIRYIIESEFVYKGGYCVCVMSNLGHRCGYVGVTKSHPLYGLDYHKDRVPKMLIELRNKVVEGTVGKRNSIDVLFQCIKGVEDMKVGFLFDVHGGITYSGNGDTGYPIKSNLHFFGFDCAHYGDSPDYISAEELGINIPQTYLLFHSDGTIRSLDYVERECMSLASQLHDIYLLY